MSDAWQPPNAKPSPRWLGAARGLGEGVIESVCVCVCVCVFMTARLGL